MSKVLSDIADYVTEKVSYHTLTDITYVGMDNMLPNRGGVTVSEYVPTEGQFTAFRKGDVLIGNIRPYFKKIWLAEYDGGCSPDVLCIRAKHNISPLFLYALLAQDVFFDYDVKGAKGSKMPRGDKDHIMAYPVPNVANADIIGLIIVTLYRKIQNNNAVCADLEAMAKLLYDYWFVQFDFPDEIGKPYKSSGGKMVWNEDLKREIPEGWDANPINHLCSIISGYPFNSETYVENGRYHVLTIKNIQDGYIVPSTDSHVSTIPSDIPKCDILNIGDILMSLTGNVGRVGILCGDNYLLNQRASLIQPKEEEIKWFLYSLFRDESIFIQIQRVATGTSQKNVSPTDIGNIVVPYSKKIVKTYSKVIRNLIQKLIACNIENQQLISLRDFLLPMLMNGQVRVGGKGDLPPVAYPLVGVQKDLIAAEPHNTYDAER